MAWIIEKFPFLKSPRFWGVVLTALLQYVKTRGWIGESEITLFRDIAAGATTVGIVGWVSKNVSKKTA